MRPMMAALALGAVLLTGCFPQAYKRDNGGPSYGKTALPPAPEPTPEPVPPTAPVAPRERGSGPWVALVVVALLLLGAAVAYAVARGGSDKSSSSSSGKA